MSYFSRFQPEHLIEFRAIRNGEVKRNWIPAKDYPLYEASLRRYNEDGWNIYASVNPRSGRGSGEDSVAEIVCFHADVDSLASPRKNTDKESAERASPNSVFSLCSFAAKPQSLSLSIPQPSMVVDSGHGRHLYWHLAEPVAVTDDNRSLLKAVNRGLALAVSGDAGCCDLSRILRVPGFTNHKTPAAPVLLVEANGLRYTLADLEPFAVHRPEPASAEIACDLKPITTELEVRFHEARLHNRDMAQAWWGKVGDGSSDSRYALIGSLRRAGFSGEEILSIVCSRKWFNCRSKQFRPPEEVEQDVRRVLGKLGASDASVRCE